MFSVSSCFQHFQKTVHDGGVLRGYVALAVEAGMKIKEVKNGGLHGIDERLAVEPVSGIGNTLFEPLYVPTADDLLLGREVYHGIEEQRQRTLHAVVALRRAQLDEAGLRVDDLAEEVVRRLDPLHQLAFADNRQIAGVHLEILLVETVAAHPVQAEQMRQIFLVGIRRYDAQPVSNYYVVSVFHAV